MQRELPDDEGGDEARPDAHQLISGAAALVALGVVCTGLAFVLYFRIVADVGSVGSSTVTYVIPVFALLFGAVLLDETIGGRTFAGMALIVGGVAGVMYGPLLESLIRRARRHGRLWSPA